MLRYTSRRSPPTASISPDLRNSALIQVRYQVEPQEKKKTPKGRAKKRITYTRRFVNVTMTGGKRKVRTMLNLHSMVAAGADKATDEPQPYLVNEFRIWSLRDGAKTGTRIAHSLATPSIHYWAARPFPSPGIHDDDSKFWRTCMADQLLFVNRNKCRRKDWFISGVFGSFFTTSVTSSEHSSLKCSFVFTVLLMLASDFDVSIKQCVVCLINHTHIIALSSMLFFRCTSVNVATIK